MRRLVYVLFFLMLADDDTALYGQYFYAPMKWVHNILFLPVAKVRPFDLCMLAVLAYSSLSKKGGRRQQLVQPMRRTLLVAALVTILSLLWGIVRGGDGRAAGWQVYLPISMLLATFTFAATCRTAEHYLGLAKVAIAAGLYHAVMCVYFDLSYVAPGIASPRPEYFTTHDDTVLWTISIGFIVLTTLSAPTMKNGLFAAITLPFLMTVIQLNNRRLAWVSLAAVLITLYVLIPPSAIKKRIRRIAAIGVPIILLYVAIGWGRPEGMFRPLKALQTIAVKDSQDNSTKARNVENLGLIATANQGWITGTGWGHKYVEISNKYSIAFFELWPYVPHNSVLGLFAYTGYFGFVGYWMTFPIAAFFHARTARLARSSTDRLVGSLGMMQIVACANQWYGDMGSFSSVTMYTLATCFAAAMRIPVSAGVWGDGADAATRSGSGPGAKVAQDPNAPREIKVEVTAVDVEAGETAGPPGSPPTRNGES